MAMNSVQTNVGAMIALQSLQSTNQQLSVTQKQISTGFRVADSTDDGAAFAIAQNVRSTVGGLTTANQQLGNVQGLLKTSQTALTQVSTTMASMRDVLVKLADQNVTGNARQQYQTQYNSFASQVQNFIVDASYNGKTLVNDTSTATPGASFGTVAVVRNETGSQYTIVSAGAAGAYGTISGLAGAAGATPLTATAAAEAITAGGNFILAQNDVGSSLNTIGSEVNYVSGQQTYNSNKIDALNSGLGALVDADLAKESAQLTALQIRQQLGTQALSMANSAPQSLLSLFK